MIRMVVDSTCDMPEGELARRDVTVVPSNIHFGTDEYQEGVTLSYEDFYRLIDELGIVPKTSQPSPGKFAQTYRDLAAQGATTIRSLHVTGVLSGTVRSAEMAAQIVKDIVDVRVFDSLAGSAGIGFMIREADEMLAAGADAEAILARWAEIRDRLRIFFYLDTLKYARMSGRVGALQSALASLLKIKPLIRLDQGALGVGERVRTRKVALARLLDLVEAEAGRGPLNLAVVHARDLPTAKDLMTRAQARFECHSTYIARLATSLVTNLGVGTLGIVAYPMA